MKIVIGCDVDPVLPRRLAKPPAGDVWQCLDYIDPLMEALGGDAPPITWLIRSDESVRFATGDFASGYLTRHGMWQSLVARGHELGWHFHLMSYDEGRQSFGFDPDPAWLGEAHRALCAHFPVRATRTGWDYGSNHVFRTLDTLGISVDLSAIAGTIGWQWAGDDRVTVDWLRCSSAPYHPSSADYQRPGQLGLVELPVAQFPNFFPGQLQRMAWRLAHGCCSTRGLRRRIRMLTQHWEELPFQDSSMWVFYFHPDDLRGEGLRHSVANIRRLRSLPGGQFLTASAARDTVA
jgi:hypothetical protein